MIETSAFYVLGTVVANALLFGVAVYIGYRFVKYLKDRQPK